MSVVPVSNLYDHNTRGKDKLYVHWAGRNYTKQCIRFELVRYLNDVPDLIKDKVHTHSLNGFSLYVKHYFIETYDIHCQIPNCYVCSTNT